MYKKALYLFFLISTPSFSSGMGKTSFFRKKESDQQITASTPHQGPGAQHKLKTPGPTPLLTLVAEKKFVPPLPKTFFEETRDRLNHYAIGIKKSIQLIIDFFEAIRGREDQVGKTIFFDKNGRMSILDLDSNLMVLKDYTNFICFFIKNFLSIDIGTYHNFIEKVNDLEALDESYCGDPWILKNTIIDYLLSLDFTMQQTTREKFFYFIKKQGLFLKKEDVENFINYADNFIDNFNRFTWGFQKNIQDIIHNKEEKDDRFYKKILDECAQYVMQFIDVYSHVEKFNKSLGSVEFCNKLYFLILESDDREGKKFNIENIENIENEMKYYTYIEKKSNKIALNIQFKESKKFLDHFFLMSEKMKKITNKLVEIKKEKDTQEKKYCSPHFVENFLKEVESDFFSEVDRIINKNFEMIIEIKSILTINESHLIFETEKNRKIVPLMALFHHIFSSYNICLENITFYSSPKWPKLQQNTISLFKSGEYQDENKFLHGIYHQTNREIVRILENAEKFQSKIKQDQENFKKIKVYFEFLESGINNLSKTFFSQLEIRSSEANLQEYDNTNRKMIDQEYIKQKDHSRKKRV